MKVEREEFILGLEEETKKEMVVSLTSRHCDIEAGGCELDKARIVAAVAEGGGQPSLARDMRILTRTNESTMLRTHDNTFSSSFSHHKLLNARAVVTYNSAVASVGIRPDFFRKDRDEEVCTLWDMIKVMTEVTNDRPSSEVVYRARKYHETSYSKFIRYSCDITKY